MALLKQWLRLEAGDSGQDAVLLLLSQAARGLVEAYTGRFFASQTVATTFELGEDYQLDPLAGEPTKVEGYFTELTQLPPSLEEYRKGISVNRELPWDVAMRQTYTVTYPINGGDVPAEAKAAILELAAEWYRNRETSAPAGEASSRELPVSYRVKLQAIRLKPIAY